MSTGSDIAEVKQRLLAMQSELQELEAAGKAAAETVELDQTRQGRLSRMDALQAQSMSKALNQRRTIELQKIGTALQRLDSGDFGYCVKCGEEIAAKRLQHDPAAPLCLNCASQAEQAGKY